jgi:hypothetical protein
MKKLVLFCRTCLPGMLFAAENLAPSLQAANLNETEEAALFSLLLWDTGVETFQPINILEIIFSFFSGSRSICRRKTGGRDATSTNTERFESILRIKRQ